MGLWVTALVGMSFGVGFNVLLLVYLLVQILRSEMPTQSTGARLLLKHNAVGLLVQGLGLAALIVWGRRLRRWSVPARLLLCLAAAALTAANVIIFSFTIR